MAEEWFYTFNEANVDCADAVLVLSRGCRISSPGTRLTRRLALSHGAPFMAADPWADSLESVKAWLKKHKPRVLMIAGPRESKPRGGDQWLRTAPSAGPTIRTIRGSVAPG